jgi:tetratricopeptide (TPR) repeat protein
MVGTGAPAGRAELPDTLRGLVAARLDGLTPEERRTLDDAAVMGRRGAVEALSIMAREMHGADDIDGAVAGLVTKDVLVLEDGKWSFRSDVVREVAYGMLTKADRVRRHTGIAKWIEHHHKTPADVDRIAHHYSVAATLVGELGGVEYVDVDLLDRALHWLHRAVEQSEAGEMYQVTAQLATQALDLDGVPTPDRLGFLLARARAEISLRELDAARADLAAAMEVAEHDPAGRARVLLVKGDLEQKAGQLHESILSLEAAIDGFRTLADDKGTADGLRALGMTMMFLDHNTAAEAAFSDALELYKAASDRRGEAWALQNLAWLAVSQGRTDRADAWLQESAATFSDIGDNGGLGWALGLLAWVRFHQGRFVEAERLAEQMLAEARERGDRWAGGMMLVLIAALRLWTGRTTQAVDPAREACDTFRTMGDWYGNSNALGVLARALVACGDIEGAFAALDDLGLIAESGVNIEWPAVITTVAAAQVGLPERADVIDIDAALDTAEPGQIGGTDLYVALGLLSTQRGNGAGAAAALEAVELRMPEWNPNVTSALALALAAANRPTEAIARATEVIESEAGTYADKIVAIEARGLALAQLGDAEGAAATFALGHTIVEGTEDVMARALLRLAEATALEAVGDERAEAIREAADHDLDGFGLGETAWRVAYAAAAGRDLVAR